MSDEFFIRATLVKERMDAVASECKRAAERGDLDRCRALNDEASVLYRAMRDIREEQLVSMLPKPKAKRRWWGLVR